ncbi:MAG TPA: isoaspartyl peptidase/L-asparaginase [Gemmatimonadales bacterium]
MYRRTINRTATLAGVALVSLGSITACAGAQATPAAGAAPATAGQQRFMLVVHGGAGTIRRQDMTPAQDSAYRATMTEAIRKGYDVLNGGGEALDAVVAVVQVLEESPLFNAGRGAVFTHEGTNELDAAIMDGTRLRAGAVAGVKHVKSPIALARLVMEESPHVMLVGAGAEEFALTKGVEMVPNSYFFTDRRWEALQRAREAQRQAEQRTGDAGAATGAAIESLSPADGKYGTVGAVAVDSRGNMAAATSTGGTTNKRWGRVGDAPVIGAGTYANDRCAISATGTGEYFIRNVVAYDVCARMSYRGTPLAEAADAVVMRKLVDQGGDGGLIAVDREGNVAMPFNTEGMYRGYVGADGRIVVKIYRGE